MGWFDFYTKLGFICRFTTVYKIFRPLTLFLLHSWASGFFSSFALFYLLTALKASCPHFHPHDGVNITAGAPRSLPPAPLSFSVLRFVEPKPCWGRTGRLTSASPLTSQRSDRRSDREADRLTEERRRRATNRTFVEKESNKLDQMLIRRGDGGRGGSSSPGVLFGSVLCDSKQVVPHPEALARKRNTGMQDSDLLLIRLIVRRRWTLTERSNRRFGYRTILGQNRSQYLCII